MKMYSCKEVSRLLSERMERKLSFWERLGLGLHLMICSVCKRVAKQLEWIQRFTQRAAKQAPTEVELSDDARNRIKQRLDKEIGNEPS